MSNETSTTKGEKIISEMEIIGNKFVDAGYSLNDALLSRLRLLSESSEPISPRRLRRIASALGEAADCLVQTEKEIEAHINAGYEIEFSGQPLHLTTDEYLVWEAMSQQPNYPFTLHEILEKAFGDDPIDAPKARLLLTSLAGKLDTPISPVRIEISGQTRARRYLLAFGGQLATAKDSPDGSEGLPEMPQPEARSGLTEREIIIRNVKQGIDRLITTTKKPGFSRRELLYTCFGRLHVDIIQYELLKKVAAEDDRLSYRDDGQEYRIISQVVEDDWIDKEYLGTVVEATLRFMIRNQQREYTFDRLVTRAQNHDGLFLISDELKVLQELFSQDPRVQFVDARSVKVNLATLAKQYRI